MQKQKTQSYSILGCSVVGLFILNLVGVAPKSLNAHANTVLYEFDSSKDVEGIQAISTTLNLVIHDSSLTDEQNFTLNVGSYDYIDHLNDTLWVGGSQGTALTGTSPGQFVYGNPSIQSLATSSNLTTVKRLYGIRLNQDIDLTHYQDVTVTFGWQMGGTVEPTSGFIATSITGDYESWSLLSEGKQNMVLSNQGTLSATHPKVTGQQARFALIFGIGKTVLALKNFTFRIEGTLRTTLDAIENIYFDHLGNYVAQEPIARQDLKFTLHYAYRLEGNTLNLDGTNVDLNIFLYQDPLNPLLITDDPFSIATPGHTTLQLMYIDPQGFGTATALFTFNVDAMVRTMTGIEAIDLNPMVYSFYEFYQPQLMVYPLYDHATSHDPLDLAIGAANYSVNYQAGHLVKDDFTLTVTYHNFIDVVDYIMIARTFEYLSVVDVKVLFTLNETFSLGPASVFTHWSQGPIGLLPFSPSAQPGYYYSSKPIGDVLITCGTFSNTLIFVMESTSYEISYNYEVQYVATSIFQYFFNNNIPVWGATSTIQYGNLLQSNLLDNAIYKSTDIPHTVTSVSPNPLGDAGAYQLTEDGLRFGQNQVGPSQAKIQSDAVVETTINKVYYASVSKLRIDIQTSSISTIKVSVSGVSTVQYDIDGGPIIHDTRATTIADDMLHTYIFYLPFVVIGKVSFEITNHITTPKPFTIHFFAYAGFALTEECQATAFAQMLNYSDSCQSDTYDELLPTYQFLSPSAKVFLTTLMVPLQDEKIGIFPSTLTAQGYWDILVARYGTTPPIASPPLSNHTMVMVFESFTFMVLVMQFIVKIRKKWIAR